MSSSVPAKSTQIQQASPARLALACLALAIGFVAPAAHAQPGGGFAITLARHDTYGPEFVRARALLLDGLVARRLVSRSHWSVVVGGGPSLIGTHELSPACYSLPDNRCAKNGDAAGVTLIAAVATVAGPAELLFGTGPAVYWADEAVSRGMQWRLDVLPRTTSKAAMGVMARATFVPQSQGIKRDMYAVGVSVRLRKTRPAVATP